jgi:ribonuclease HI
MTDYVVYMDGSMTEKDQHSFIGVGIYMIDSELDDIKISKSLMFKGNCWSSELETLKVFLNFIEDHGLIHNKKFTFYCDSEETTYVLNNKDDLKLKIKNKFNKRLLGLLDKLDVDGAYWIKGHREEVGNVIVDHLAYDALKEALNQNLEYESITLNEPYFLDSKSVSSRSDLKNLSFNDNKEINELCFNRIHDKENNFKSKADSNHNMESIVLRDMGDFYQGDIQKEEDDFLLNEIVCKDGFLGVVKTISNNVNILKEMKRFKPFYLNFNDSKIYDEVLRIIDVCKHEVDNYTSEQKVEFFKDDLNKSLFTLNKKYEFSVMLANSNVNEKIERKKQKIRMSF